MTFTVLTNDEMKILQCIADGLSHRQIGRRLFKSKKTVDAKAAALRAKLGATNNPNLVSIAYKNKILIIE